LPENYRQWKQSAIAHLRGQYSGDAPLDAADVVILLKGKHSRRGDLDNISGSILDALVQAEILRDDNLMVVRSLAARLEWDKSSEPCAIVQLL
jgi:Holliday junction resolvase RusA-like endonuclease